jgi:hypothetical protein
VQTRATLSKAAAPAAPTTCATCAAARAPVPAAARDDGFGHSFRAIAVRTGDPAAGGEKQGTPPPPGQPARRRRACVVPGSERIPVNRTGLQHAWGQVTEEFDMQIDWLDNAECDPSCGEYRQYVRGSLYVNDFPDAETLHLWAAP